MKNNVTVTVNWTQILVVVLVGIILAGCIIGFSCGCGKQDTVEPTPVVPTVNPVVEVTEGPEAVHTPEAIPATPEPTPTPTPTPEPTPTATPDTASTSEAAKDTASDKTETDKVDTDKAADEYNGWPAIPANQLPQPDSVSTYDYYGSTVVVPQYGQQTQKEENFLGIQPDQPTAIIPGYNTDAVTTTAVSNLAQQIFDLTNAERTSRGLNALSYSYDLQEAANTRAREASVKFSHTRPNGQSCHDIVTKDYNVTGENLIMADKPIATAENLVAEWMSSEGHRYNILLPEFTELAVGVYESGGVVYACQIFLG